MTTLKLHAEPVQDTWLDAYGHLNEGYYLVAFSNATWPLQAHFGVGTDYFDETGCALYTVESHIRYLQEVRAPAMLEIESLILGVEPKKLHIAHVMTVDSTERATFECLLLHFDTRAGGVTPMPDDVVAGLEAAAVAALPDWSGRAVSTRRK
ncbi:MAG: thioesterase family protein [Rhodospirillales bacterium]